MKVGSERDEFIFSSGKKICANRGIIGISIDHEERFYVFEGYDGYFSDQSKTGEDGLGFDLLTKAEFDELADFMIELWNKRKYMFGECDPKTRIEILEAKVKQISCIVANSGSIVYNNTDHNGKQAIQYLKAIGRIAKC